MATKCPACGSADTQSLVSVFQCLACAAEFDPNEAGAAQTESDAAAEKPRRGLLKK